MGGGLVGERDGLMMYPGPLNILLLAERRNIGMEREGKEWSTSVAWWSGSWVKVLPTAFELGGD